MSNTEPYGTTPLPAKGVSIRYDPGDVWDVAQQPKSQQIAAYEGIKNDESIHGATVFDVNHHFCIYAVKKGLIRILHRHSTLRTLFRGHEGQVVTDIQIFLDGDVLGSVGSANGSSTVIIWRVFERTPEIMSEKLLEITTSAYTISRLIWHPFNPNQFWIIHTKDDSEGQQRKVASLVDTTRISTLPHATEQHAVCMFHTPNIIMEGAVELSAPSASSLTDLDWSEKDVRHVLTAHYGGEIRLWDLRKLEHANNQATMLPACICMIQEDQPLSRCKFLPHECPRDQASKRENSYTNCFLTAANNNTVVTLWSPFCETGSPTKLQVFGLENPSPSYLLDICYGPSPPDGPPPSLFVLMADQSEGKLFSWHLKSVWQEQTVVALVGCDYVVPFLTSFPMYSWSTQVQPAADISEDELTDQGGLVFDMKLFSYQSTVVQCLTLTSFMCLPPASQWEPSTPGVRAEDLAAQESESVEASPGDLAMSEDFDGEDYDIGDDDEIGDEEYDGPPEASSLPAPEGLESPATGPVQSNNTGGGAFANWLGALAVKAPGLDPIPPPPVPQGMPPATTMLTPADLFPNHPSIQAAEKTEEQTSVPTPPPPPPPPGMNANDQNQLNASVQNKKKNNRKGKSRSRSPANRNKQNSRGRGQQQQPQAAQDVTILLRKPDEAQFMPATDIGAPAVATSQTSAGLSLSNEQLADLFQKQEAAITREIHSAVEKEMKFTIVPLIDEKVRACVNEAVGPVMSSINEIGQSGVQVDHDMLVNAITAKVEEPLRATFAENMKNVFIPAFQSVSAQMFAQVSASLENGIAQGSAAAGSQKKDMEELTRQMGLMAAQMQQLSSEVSGLKSLLGEKGVTGGQLKTPGVAPAVSAAEQKQALQKEVLALLQQRQYEAAFTKALSASTVEMALFVCRNADLGDVLGGTSPSLSQPILLCLMHQLGTSVVTETNDEASLQTELAWLQEVSLSINPMDESMKRHLPGVLQQLVSGINDKMMRTDQQSRRPLQRLLQVLRGVQVQ